MFSKILSLAVAVAVIVTLIAVFKTEDADQRATRLENGTYLEDEYIVLPSVTMDKKGDQHKHINSDMGSIEFWFKPDWKLDDNSEKQKTKDLFFWGDATNKKCIWINKQYGALAVLFASQSHKTFLLQLPLNTVEAKKAYNLDSMVWHHVAVCWDMTGTKKWIKIFLDGKTEGVRQPTEGVWAERWKEAEAGFDGIPTDKPMYFGTALFCGDSKLNRFSPEFEVAQFRISDIPRYAGAFSPQQKLAFDKHTLLYMPFADNLDGEYYKHGKKAGKMRGKTVKIGG